MRPSRSLPDRAEVRGPPPPAAVAVRARRRASSRSRACSRAPPTSSRRWSPCRRRLLRPAPMHARTSDHRLEGPARRGRLRGSRIGRSLQKRAHRDQASAPSWRSNHLFSTRVRMSEVGLRAAQHRRRAERGQSPSRRWRNRVRPAHRRKSVPVVENRVRPEAVLPSASSMAIRRDLWERIRRFRQGTKHISLAASVHLCT